MPTWLPWWLSRERICLQCRRRRFDPWVGKIPWRREGMAARSRVLAWRIPWTGVPGGLQSGVRELDMTRSCPLCLFTPQEVHTLSSTLDLKSTFLSPVHAVKRAELTCKQCPIPEKGLHLCPPAVQLLAVSITGWPQVLERAWHTPVFQQNSVNSAEQIRDIWLLIQHDHPLSPWGQRTFLDPFRWETTSKQFNSDKVCFDT